MRPLPCVHEEAIISYCQDCQSGGRHVRGCGIHETATREFVASHVKDCDNCGDYLLPDGPLIVHLGGAGGIGDAICGMYAACGLAEAMKRPVVYRCRYQDWLAGCWHPNVSLAIHAPEGADMAGDYGKEMEAAAYNSCPTRADWYCRNLAKSFGIPDFAPVRPQEVKRPEPVLGTGYDLVSPFSADPRREWATGGWVDLVRTLCQENRKVVILGKADHKARLEVMFGHLPVMWYFGMPPAWVVSAVANADRVYGNDSAVAHLGGLHNVKTIAVMTHLSPRFVFGHAPSVRGVGADLTEWPCQGCAWRNDRGYREICPNGCPALLSIPFHAVHRAGI